MNYINHDKAFNISMSSNKSNFFYIYKCLNIYQLNKIKKKNHKKTLVKGIKVFLKEKKKIKQQYKEMVEYIKIYHKMRKIDML